MARVTGGKRKRAGKHINTQLKGEGKGRRAQSEGKRRRAGESTETLNRIRSIAYRIEIYRETLALVGHIQENR